MASREVEFITDYYNDGYNPFALDRQAAEKHTQAALEEAFGSTPKESSPLHAQQNEIVTISSLLRE